MIDVRISEDFAADGIGIWITQKREDGARIILHFAGEFTVSWDLVEPGTDTPPTLKLPDDSARALLDALLRHYEGASDMRTVRSDLLYERARADRLQEVLVQLVMRKDS